jgi:Glyoxalase-like domain
MSIPFQIVIDCKDPELMAGFWAAALGYVLEPPPGGFATWDDWRRDIGLPDSYLGMGADSIIDPGGGPRMWFRAEDAARAGKNRFHFDIHVSGGRTVIEGRSVPIATRRQRVDGEARRLADLGATITGPLGDGDDLDHYAVGMRDPEGNEFDIN